MVGNDIVDLKVAGENAWKRKRFLDKVLLPSEKELLLSSADPSKFFWILWSMKESAYKIHFRKTLKRALNPLRFQCFYNGKVQGRVETDNCAFQTMTSITGEYVHTIAWEGDSNVILTSNVVTECGPNLRNKILDCMIRSFSKERGLNPQDLNFEKDEHGLPLLSRNNEVLNRFCSMSHHGRFGAFAFA